MPSCFERLENQKCASSLHCESIGRCRFRKSPIVYQKYTNECRQTMRPCRKDRIMDALVSKMYPLDKLNDPDQIEVLLKPQSGATGDIRRIKISANAFGTYTILNRVSA